MFKALGKIASSKWALVQKHWLITALMLSLAFLVVLFWGVFYLEKSFHSDSARQEIHFFVQVITGNWSAPPFATQYSKRPYMISLSISIAIGLSLASLGLLTLVISQLRKMRRTPMYNYQFDSFCDAVLKASILEEFPPEQRADISEKLQRGFANGRRKLLTDEYLRIPFPSESDRDEMKARPKRDVFSPKI